MSVVCGVMLVMPLPGGCQGVKVVSGTEPLAKHARSRCPVDQPFAIVFLSTRAHGASNQSIVSFSIAAFPIHSSSKAFFRTIYCIQAEYYRVNMRRVRLDRERERELQCGIWTSLTAMALRNKIKSVSFYSTEVTLLGVNSE